MTLLHVVNKIKFKVIFFPFLKVLLIEEEKKSIKVNRL